MVAIPAQPLADVEQATADTNVQAILLAIAYYESGWSAGAIGDYTVDCQNFYGAAQAPAGSWPTSFGYLQMHNNAGGCPSGLGNGYTEAQLLDGVFNLQLGAQHVSAALAAGNTVYEAMAPWSTRDADYQLYQQIVAGGWPPGSGGGSGGLDAATVVWILAALLALDEVL